MADIRWDAQALPQIILQTGYQEGDVNNLVKNTMDRGPMKRRPKSTKAYLPITVNMLLTYTQKATFDTFYTDTIKYGAIPFIMPTYTGTDMEVFLTRRNLVPKGGNRWTLTMELSTLY